MINLKEPKMFNYKNSLFILLLFLHSCCNVRMIKRCANNYTKVDTLVVHDTIKGFDLDTIFVRENTIDTFVLKQDGVKVETILQHDTIYQSLEVEPKIVEVKVPCETQVVEVNEVDILLKRWSKIALFMGLFLILGFIIYMLYKLFKKITH